MQPDAGEIWGFPNDRGSAEVSVQGQNVKITTAVNSVVQVSRGADGLLRGNLVSRDGNEFMLTMRRVQ